MNTFFKIASLLLGVANASAGLTNVVPYPKVKPGSDPYPKLKRTTSSTSKFSAKATDTTTGQPKATFLNAVSFQEAFSLVQQQKRQNDLRGKYSGVSSTRSGQNLRLSTAKQGLRTSSRRPDIAVTTPPPNMSLPEGTIRPTFGSRSKPRPSTSAGSRHDSDHVRAGQRLQKSVSELVDNESGGFYRPKRDTVENRRVAEVKLKKNLKFKTYFGCLH